MERRSLLKGVAGVVAPLLRPSLPALAAGPLGNGALLERCRPGDAAWPSEASWDRLAQQVGGHLVEVPPPLAACRVAPDGPTCQELGGRLRNPYFLGDEIGLTQTSGWLDAWTSAPSAYAVAARHAGDVAAAVNFARENRLRLVVKGGGHSYQGTSNAPDSLLVWTRRMDATALHDAFVAEGCAADTAQPAVSLGAGAIWMQAYDAVTTRAGRYVQGGGCTTVGVAGLVQSGGFGSFSKAYGLAAASLLEAEVVTADGAVRTANACSHPDLFWALKGGGGGSLGVVTRLTLRTHALPDTFGAVRGVIQARSDAAYQRLVTAFVDFYAGRLCNAHWGETVTVRPDNTLRVAMAFQGLDRAQAEAEWRGFLGWVGSASADFAVAAPFQFITLPARHLWDAAYLRQHLPGAVIADDRPGAPEGNVYWAGDAGQAGQFIHGYGSAWLPRSLLAGSRQAELSSALFAASRHWPVALHFNKGLAGAPAEVVTAAADTAMHPAVLDAFALAVSAGEGPPAFPGLPGLAPDMPAARRHAASIRAALREVLRAAPGAGSYVSEGGFFDTAWQASHWGPNYPRLRAVKDSYDPDGLFFVHHGVGSERWSADGFTRLA